LPVSPGRTIKCNLISLSAWLSALCRLPKAYEVNVLQCQYRYNVLQYQYNVQVLLLSTRLKKIVCFLRSSAGKCDFQTITGTYALVHSARSEQHADERSRMPVRRRCEIYKRPWFTTYAATLTMFPTPALPHGGFPSQSTTRSSVQVYLSIRPHSTSSCACP
jgi:hypothetical protein